MLISRHVGGVEEWVVTNEIKNANLMAIPRHQQAHLFHYLCVCVGQRQLDCTVLCCCGTNWMMNKMVKEMEK